MTPAAITLPGFLCWLDTDGCQLVSEALATRVFADMERDRVNAYQLPGFAAWGFVDKRTGEPIIHPCRLYLSGDDEKCAAYFDAVDALHRAHGFTGPKGHCPALIAEHAQRIAESAVIDSLSAFLGINSPWDMTHRAKMLDLAIGAAVKRMDEKGHRRAVKDSLTPR